VFGRYIVCCAINTTLHDYSWNSADVVYQLHWLLRNFWMHLTLQYTLKLLCFQNKGFIDKAKDPFSGFNGPAGGGDGSSDFGGEDMFKDGEVLYISLAVGVGCFHSTIGSTD